MNVAPDSPGALAGLVRGEYILEAGGKAVKGMPLEEVRQMLRTDGKYSFTVERQGKRRSVTVELKRLF
ncbi:MAG: PDZ domain-containing protein [Vicinamibacteria bacterium]|nr:PDZ domain-containing protein [Vicinamibacteria bacterium]